jgi:hypothetical protein
VTSGETFTVRQNGSGASAADERARVLYEQLGLPVSIHVSPRRLNGWMLDWNAPGRNWPGPCPATAAERMCTVVSDTGSPESGSGHDGESAERAADNKSTNSGKGAETIPKIGLRRNG